MSKFSVGLYTKAPREAVMALQQECVFLIWHFIQAFFWCCATPITRGRWQGQSVSVSINSVGFEPSQENLQP